MDGVMANDFTSSRGILTTVGEFADSYREPCAVDPSSSAGQIDPCELQHDVCINITKFVNLALELWQCTQYDYICMLKVY